MSSKWLEKHCDCEIDANVDDKGQAHPMVSRCNLHEFAEKASELMNLFVKDLKVTNEGIKSIVELLDNYGLLEE